MEDREWEQRYLDLMQNLLNGYVLYEVEMNEDGEPADFIVLEVNHAFEEITGLKRTGVVGRRMTEIYQDIFNGEFDFISVLGQVAITGDSIRVDQYLHFLQQCYTMAAYRPRAGQLAMVFADVTQTRRLARKCAEQRHFIQEVLEALPNPLVYKDSAGFIEDCNNAFARVVGLPKQEIIGRSHAEILPKPIYNRMMTMQAVMHHNSGVQVYEYQLPYADGSVRDIFFHEAAIQRENGAPDGTVGVMVDITQRKRMEEQVAYQVYHDLLTGLANQRLFEERARMALAQAKRSRSLVGVGALDLDGLKRINDSQGRDTGDLVLQEAAQRLKRCLRDGDTVARVGGDDFLLLLPGLDECTSCERITGRILTTLQKPFLIEGRELYLTANIGVSVYPQDADDAPGLIKRANFAMAQAKQLGPGTVCHTKA
ncbi:MAG TPA: diguanylate cyclase [Patescibacteria group bacterium]|nr:diguanylate cyclase [Patescibacteria group bacterium]